MVLAAPAPAIALAHEIAGVALGTRRTALTRRLGAGTVASSGTGSFGRFVVVAYARPAVRVTFVHGVATTVSTRSRVYRTRLGIAVGTSSAALHHAYGAQLRCGNFQICTIGRALPGHALTTFYLQNGRVLQVEVASVLD